MSEEQNQQTTDKQPTPPEPTDDPNPNVEFKESKVFEHMRGQINDLRKQLDDRDAKAREAEEAAERARLEEQGKWEERAKRADADLAAANAAHADEIRRLELEAGFAGIENEYTRAGVIAKCPEDTNPAEYIADVRDKNPDLWQSSTESESRNAAPGKRSGGGRTDWSTIKADMRSKDPKRVNPAIAQYEAYIREHHKKPPGWD